MGWQVLGKRPAESEQAPPTDKTDMVPAQERICMAPVMVPLQLGMALAFGMAMVLLLLGRAKALAWMLDSRKNLSLLRM